MTGVMPDLDRQAQAYRDAFPSLGRRAMRALATTLLFVLLNFVGGIVLTLVLIALAAPLLAVLLITNVSELEACLISVPIYWCIWTVGCRWRMAPLAARGRPTPPAVDSSATTSTTPPATPVTMPVSPETSSVLSAERWRAAMWLGAAMAEAEAKAQLAARTVQWQASQRGEPMSPEQQQAEIARQLSRYLAEMPPNPLLPSGRPAASETGAPFDWPSHGNNEKTVHAIIEEALAGDRAKNSETRLTAADVACYPVKQIDSEDRTMRLSRWRKAAVIAGSILVGVALAEVASSAMVYALEDSGPLRVCIETGGRRITDKPMDEGLARIIGRQCGEWLEREGVRRRFANAHSWPVTLAVRMVAGAADPIVLAIAALFSAGCGGIIFRVIRGLPE